MSTAATILLALYTLGLVMTALVSATLYVVEAPADYERGDRREKARTSQRRYARIFVLSPIWPILAIAPLRKIINDAKGWDDA